MESHLVRYNREVDVSVYLRPSESLVHSPVSEQRALTNHEVRHSINNG